MQYLKGLQHVIYCIAAIRKAGRNTIIRRMCSSNKNRRKESFPEYSLEQQNYIIGILQNCVLNNITRPYLNEKRIQSLKSLFENNGDIPSLERLLNVNGIGPKLLHRICDNILEPETYKDSEVQTGVNEKHSHSLITPSFIYQNNVESLVSIHLGINALSWTRMWTSGSSKDQVDRWNVMDLSEFMDKKYDVHTVWDLVLQCREVVPNGDIYVMENNNWSNVANIKKPMKYHIQEAMLTTALCSVFNQTDSQGKPRMSVENRLYFIRTFTPSRLFKKIVGSERVSAQDIVLNMMEGIADTRYRPVTFSDNTPDVYFALNGSQRDDMCRALLLAVSFAELIIHRNPNALSVIGKSTVAKKKP